MMTSGDPHPYPLEVIQEVVPTVYPLAPFSSSAAQLSSILSGIPVSDRSSHPAFQNHRCRRRPLADRRSRRGIIYCDGLYTGLLPQASGWQVQSVWIVQACGTRHQHCHFQKQIGLCRNYRQPWQHPWVAELRSSPHSTTTSAGQVMAGGACPLQRWSADRRCCCCNHPKWSRSVDRPGIRTNTRNDIIQKVIAGEGSQLSTAGGHARAGRPIIVTTSDHYICGTGHRL